MPTNTQFYAVPTTSSPSVFFFLFYFLFFVFCYWWCFFHFKSWQTNPEIWKMGRDPPPMLGRQNLEKFSKFEKKNFERTSEYLNSENFFQCMICTHQAQNIGFQKKKSTLGLFLHHHGFSKWDILRAWVRAPIIFKFPRQNTYKTPQKNF